MHTVTWISSFLCVPVKRTPPYSRHLSLRSHTFRTLKIVHWQITCKKKKHSLKNTLKNLCSRSGFYVQLQSSTFYPFHQNLNKHGWKEGTALRPDAAAMTTPTSVFLWYRPRRGKKADIFTNRTFISVYSQLVRNQASWAPSPKCHFQFRYFSKLMGLLRFAVRRSRREKTGTIKCSSAVSTCMRTIPEDE